MLSLLLTMVASIRFCKWWCLRLMPLTIHASVCFAGHALCFFVFVECTRDRCVQALVIIASVCLRWTCFYLFCAVERTRDRCAHSACRVIVLAALCVRAAYAWPLRVKGVSFICAHVFRSLIAFVFFCCAGQGALCRGARCVSRRSCMSAESLDFAFRTSPPTHNVDCSVIFIFSVFWELFISNSIRVIIWQNCTTVHTRRMSTRGFRYVPHDCCFSLCCRCTNVSWKQCSSVVVI